MREDYRQAQKPSQCEKFEFTPDETEFLNETYLGNEYIVDPEVKAAINTAVSKLKDKFSRYFMFLTLVGGQSNGSYVLRQSQSGRFGSDVDFYFGGFNPEQKILRAMSSEVSDAIRTLGLAPDGLLNGREVDRFLNVSDIKGHIEREDFDLLALPFQCVFGDAKSAQRAIQNEIGKERDPDQIWDQIREYHAQSLYLANGQWSEKFNNAILSNYTSKKIDKFRLPPFSNMAA